MVIVLEIAFPTNRSVKVQALILRCALRDFSPT